MRIETTTAQSFGQRESLHPVYNLMRIETTVSRCQDKWRIHIHVNNWVRIETLKMG
jgi:hypothetical protein